VLSYQNNLTIYIKILYNKYVQTLNLICLLKWSIDMPLPEVEFGNDEPLYNIGAVSRMTGITMATLRAWERRYDFPASRRTSGGHRLYSERDILQLRWVKDRTEEGMQISHAVAALHHQEQAGKAVLISTEEERAKLSEFDSAQVGEERSFASALSQRLFENLLRRDTIHADETLNEALAMLTPEEVILGVISPVLNRIGEGWEQGILSISTEHLGTNYLRQRLLMWMLNSPPPVKMAPVLLACAPEEWHEGSLLVIGALLRRRRWPIAYLGQSVPMSDLATFVRDIKPSMLVLVAMTENTANTLAEWPRWMPEAHQHGKPMIGYGGRIFVEQPKWCNKISGLYLGNTFEDGINLIERTLQGLGNLSQQY
jgi:DNA-binding transcriptional MerR regulator